MLVSVKVAIGVCVVGVVVAILGAILGFAVLPNVVDDQIAKSVRLEKTEQYHRWEKLPFPLTFKVYLFHVKNPTLVNDGGIPEVEERGPYVYKQYREKVDVNSEDEGITITYNQSLNFQFDQTASGKLTEEDLITVLNVPRNGLFQVSESRNLEETANDAAKDMFKDTDDTSMFHTVTVGQYLFSGYDFCIDADIEKGWEYIKARTTCMLMVGQSKTVEKIGKYTLKFAFFKSKNETDDGLYHIASGMNDASDTGEILKWKGLSKQNVWVKDSACNDIKGRDASIYPPYNDKDTKHTVFSSDICRTVVLNYDKEITYEGIDGHRSIFPDNIFASGKTNKDNECYCIKKTKDLDSQLECLPDGFVDMHNCLGSPIVLSHPHLLWADKRYQATVKGLKPDIEKHNTFVELQPDTGTPLQGGKRIQFNMIVRNIPGIDSTSKLTNFVMPLLWVEEGTALPDNLVDKLKNDFVSKLDMVEGLKWGLIGAGLALAVITGVFAVYKSNSKPIRELR